jgi:V8-like Glu-specific endopeptidase
VLLVPLIVTPVAAAPADVAVEHARILAYWTPVRMAAARPLTISPTVSGGTKGKSVPTASGTVTGSSWTNHGPVMKLTGKVFFHMPNGDYICSGSVITDSRAGNSTVLTAGHCAYDFTSGFVTNWMFIPNFDANPTYDCASTTYGCWTATALVIHYGFRYAGAFTEQAAEHDWAFAVVGAGGKNGTQLDMTVGGSYAITLGASSTRLEAFGYPAGAPYAGSDLTWCAGPATADLTSATGATWAMACDMTGGASGGPWFVGLNEKDGTGGSVGSLNSYKYDAGRVLGPRFNSNTQATLTVALSSTSGNLVAGSQP